MDNPYISRGPVRQPEMFFGREHELNEIVAFIRGNQSISFIGPRKIGKTSLLFHIIRPQIWSQIGLGDDNLFIYFDCEVLGDLSHNEIFREFSQEMAIVLEERNVEPEANLEKAIQDPSRLSWERALRSLNRRGLRVILILDEFERLSTNEQLDVNFFNALRSAAGRYQLAFITASAHPLIQLTYSGRSQDILSSPFFNIFAPLFLGLMPENEARQLIQEPAQHAGSPFSEDQANFIYSLVGGHPLGLQVACFHALNSDGGFEEIKNQTIAELDSHYQYYWNNLSTAEKGTLFHLNDAATRSLADTTLRGMLRDLIQKCLLIRDDETYRHVSQTWANFVEHQQLSNPPVFSVNMIDSGSRIGAYEVIEPLARGGMSEIYKGKHTRLDREVAIKVLPTSLADEADFRDRFEREAKAVASLRHPNIVQVYDFGDIDDTYYMVMELIQGNDLDAIIEENIAMSMEMTLAITSQISSALDYAHQQTIIHRDVKPSNVIIEGKGDNLRAILTDFGIAKIRARDTSATKTGVMMGTTNYIAPEQIRSAGEVNSRADIYSLGVMLFQMLTGRLPFEGDNPGSIMIAHLQDHPPDPRDVNPNIPANVALGILQALDKEPQKRQGKSSELIDILRVAIS
ncbi:MAG: protein kinase [Chloroflexi bacterium]|nr:protein kinase [Chloroflexota bacterium]